MTKKIIAAALLAGLVAPAYADPTIKILNCTTYGASPNCHPAPIKK